MLRSIATVSIAGTLTEKLYSIAEAGFQGVEIFEPDLQAFPGSPRDIAALCEDLGLQIVLYQPFRNYEGMPLASRPVNLARARETFSAMQQLGCFQLLLCSNVDEQASPDRDQQVADLAVIAAMAQDHGIRIGFEALAWGRHINRYRQTWERVKAVDSPALGLVLDSFHVLSLNDSLNLDDIPLEKIFFVQIADAPLKQLDVLEWSRHYRCFPGEGDLPVVDFAWTLLEKGYRGPWSLEIFNDAYQRAAPAATAAAGSRSLRWLEEQLSQRLVKSA